MNKIAIKHYNVESSNIESIGHSFPRRILEIKFKNGGTYRYKGVARNEFRKLLDAPSKGKAFHQHIKSRYPYKKYKDSEGNHIGDEYKEPKRKPSEILDEMVLHKKRGSE